MSPDSFSWPGTGSLPSTFCPRLLLATHIGAEVKESLCQGPSPALCPPAMGSRDLSSIPGDSEKRWWFPRSRHNSLPADPTGVGGCQEGEVGSRGARRHLSSEPWAGSHHPPSATITYTDPTKGLPGVCGGRVLSLGIPSWESGGLGGA